MEISVERKANMIKPLFDTVRKAWSEWENKRLSDYGLIKIQKDTIDRLEKKLERYGLMDE
jgi:methionine synthase II (cobalamin-independent)